MNKMQEQVKDWSVKFQQLVNTKPVIPPLEIRKLRARLILEEALETISGLGFAIDLENNSVFDSIKNTKEGQYLFAPDIEQIVDGIADSIFVQLGTAIACGIDIEPVWDEVVRSNNSKLWTPNEFINQPDNYTAIAVKSGTSTDKILLVTDTNGKAIKSPSYSPANIAPLIAAQQQ